MDKLNIYQKINEVRKECPYLKKDAQVQGYKAVSHDAVTGFIRESLINQGVLIVPQLKASNMIATGTTTGSGVPWMRYEAKWDIDFVNIENPEDKITVPMESHALDHGDKAPGKACSYATKYAILKLFNIETGEDDESRETQKPIDETFELQKQIKLLNSMWKLRRSIDAIRDGIARDDIQSAAESWFELDNDEKQLIWIAPTKAEAMGIEPPFTIKEREIIKSVEFRDTYYGDQE